MDWRGSGKSSPPKIDEDVSIEQMGRDVHSLLDRLEVEQCHLIGHDIGGLIALEAAQINPTRFQKILLLDSVGPRGIPLDLHKKELLEKKKKKHIGMAVINVLALASFGYAYQTGMTALPGWVLGVMALVFSANIAMIFWQRTLINKALVFLDEPVNP